MTEYVFQDRTTVDKWAMTISDGELSLATTASAASADPIVEDKVNTGNYFEIYVEDGELKYASTVTVQDDDVTIEDSVTGDDYQLQVRDGEFIAVRLFSSTGASRFAPLHLGTLSLGV